MDEESTKPTRTEYFDVLRCVAIVAVVVLHTSAARWPLVEPATAQWHTLNVYDSVTRFCVPIFFMISGALFLDPSRRITVDSIVRRSLPRLAIAYVVWSGFFALFSAVVLKTNAGLLGLLTSWMTGHYHLWFLLVLMGLYLVTPLLRKVCESPTLARYFVILAVLFAVVLPTSTILPIVGPLIGTVLQTAQLQLVLGYSIFFVLGRLLHEGLFAGVRTIWLVLAGLLALLVTIGATAWLSVSGGQADGWFYAYLTPNVLVMSIVVFLCAKRWGDSHRLSTRSARAVALLGGCSFGIYLIHPLFQELFALAGFTSDSFPAIASVPVLAVAILVPSFVCAWLLRRIPRVGRYLS